MTGYREAALDPYRSPDALIESGGGAMTINIELPSQEYLCQRFEYDPETGVLLWRYREGGYPQWNKRFAGKPALNAQLAGYRRGKLDGKYYRAHRIIWKLVFGTEPQNIDHINGDRGDNRIDNLRSVGQSENLKNMRRRRDNISGVTGVCWFKARSKWHVRVKVCGKDRHIGYFADFEQAVAARKEAEKLNGYHPNHGRA